MTSHISSNSKEFINAIEENTNVACYFYLGWNDASIAARDIFYKSMDHIKTDVKLMSIDVSVYPKFKEDLKIRMFPVIIFYQDKNEIKRSRSFMTVEGLVKKLDKVYNSK